MTKKAGKRPGGGSAQASRGFQDKDVQVLTGLLNARNYQALEDAARRVLDRRPGHPFATKALSAALLQTQQFAAAIPLLRYAVKAFPNDSELCNNLGIALVHETEWGEAIVFFERAIELSPRNAVTYKNLGLAYHNMSRWNDSVPPLLKAIELFDGDYIDAIFILAVSLGNANRFDEAAVCLSELHKENPNHLGVLFQLIVAKLRRCDWLGLGDNLRTLEELSDSYRLNVAPPFMSLAMPGVTADRLLRMASVHLRDRIGDVSPRQELKWPQADIDPGAEPRRLKIGYLSADIRNHPVAYVLPEVIERHDRRQFEVMAYAMKAEDDSLICQRLKNAFDQFIDVEALSIRQTVERIRADQIDILVDLQGWTEGMRPEALARGCAPVQVSWLGYAGTTGSDQLADYLIGDPVSTPVGCDPDFAETIVRLPGCYLPTDTTVVPSPVPGRVEAGLPAEGFVFSSLNNGYKFNPDSFDLWCRILKSVPGSVLWLTRPFESAQANLRREAEARGVSGERILFAPFVAKQEDHLARLQLADLALDTFPYNSHSSGLHALWAGVPMVSLAGQTFAGRVGASMLVAAGLEELVVASPDEYHDLAIRLATHPAELDLLKKRLAVARQQSPLFDMRSFVINLEQIYLDIWSRFIAKSKAVAAH